MDAPFPTGMIDDIRSFFNEVHPSLKPGLSVYPEVLQRPHFYPLQRTNELAWMMDRARSYNPTTVFEIGSDKGGGLYHWCQCLPSVRQVIACEIRGTPYRDLFETHFPHIEFLWLDGISSFHGDTITQVDKWLSGDDIDCLFIDGDKSHFDTDFDVYLPYMAPKSVAFMHDINDRPPGDQYLAVRKRGYKGETFINTEDSLEAVHRSEAELPIANPHEAWLRYWKGASCGVGAIYLNKEEDRWINP